MVFTYQGSTDTDLLAMIFWLIWEKRNADHMRDNSFCYQDIRPRAIRLLHDFSAAQLPQKTDYPSVLARRVRWIPPISSSYKVNYDRAIFKEIGVVGLGVVIRDAEGSMIGALMERIPLPLAVATMEALACRRVVLFVKELSIFDATFENDSKIVTNALCGGGSNHPEFGLIIMDSLVLARGFRSCNFVHVKRLDNLVAHFLTKKSKSSNKLLVWIESIPDDIAPLVSRDIL